MQDPELQFEQLQDYLSTLKKELEGKELIPTQGVIEKIRMIKEKSEIKLEEKIEELLETALNTIETIVIKPGE